MNPINIPVDPRSARGLCTLLLSRRAALRARPAGVEALDSAPPPGSVGARLCPIRVGGFAFRRAADGRADHLVRLLCPLPVETRSPRSSPTNSTRRGLAWTM